MIPMTPSGTRTRAMRSPLGRVHSAITWPIGSGRAAISSSPFAIASIRTSSSSSRSRMDALSPLASAPCMSLALAARISALRARIAAAASVRARLRAAPEDWPSACMAARAARAMSAIRRRASMASSVRVAFIRASSGEDSPATRRFHRSRGAMSDVGGPIAVSRSALIGAVAPGGASSGSTVTVPACAARPAPGVHSFIACCS